MEINARKYSDSLPFPQHFTIAKGVTKHESGLCTMRDCTTDLGPFDWDRMIQNLPPNLMLDENKKAF